MSDNIPFEIQLGIIKRLPVKSLIQFRSVSKTWKSLIDSSDFIAGYNSQQQHLLVRYKADFKEKCVSIVDDDTFPINRVPVTLPLLVNTFETSFIIGSSHGLICFYGNYPNSPCGPYTHMAVIWNLSIRKAVTVIVPIAPKGLYDTVLGFGICRETTDPKIVKITYKRNPRDMESVSCIPGKLDVFTLSTGDWRSSFTNLPRKSIKFNNLTVAVDGFLYWLASDTITIDDGFRSYKLIISFDLTSEEFTEVNLPDSLALSDGILYISKLKESLVVLESHGYGKAYIVWLMDGGGPKLFTKLFTISTPDATIIGVLEFRKSGEPVIQIIDHGSNSLGYPSLLVVYEPYAKHIDILRIDGIYSFSFSVTSYIESLLLLDQPNSIIYGKVNTTF